MKRSRAPLDSRCAFCHQSIPYYETARTLETPPDQVRLPVGSGWVICGPDCPQLPEDALVFYRGNG